MFYKYLARFRVITCICILLKKKLQNGYNNQNCLVSLYLLLTLVVFLPNALSVLANDAPTGIPASLGVAKEEGQAKKKRLLWLKLNKKINTIYADWIDDSPLVFPNLPIAEEI